MKHLRKCDGYVLPYVLVVFLILSAVAVSICSTSLNNLKAQEAAVERSKALYEAEGEVEKFVAGVMGLSESDESTDRNAAIDDFFDPIAGTSGLTIRKAENPEKADSYNLKLQVKCGEAHIETVMQITLVVDSRTETTKNDKGEIISTKEYYKVTGTSCPTYNSYDISYTGGAT